MLPPWLHAMQRLPHPDAAAAFTIVSGCRYELPNDYSTLMVQYRQGGEACVPRTYTPGNGTRLSGECSRLLACLLWRQPCGKTVPPKLAGRRYCLPGWSSVSTLWPCTIPPTTPHLPLPSLDLRGGGRLP